MKNQTINQKGFAPIVIILIVIGILALGGASYYVIKKFLPQPAQKIEQPTSTQPSSEEPSYKEPEPMPAPQTVQQSVRFDLPAETPLNNENLKLSSFYGAIDVSGQDIKSHKILSVKITDSEAGQLLLLLKESDGGKMKYNLPIYIEKTDGVYIINITSIAKGFVWMNPLMMFQDKSIKPLLMEKISKDNMFTKTIYFELEYLLKTKPEEIGGDLQGERGERLIKLVTKVIENNLEEKIDETKTTGDYYDCGASKSCLSEQALNCKLAKGKISEYGNTMEHIIKGEEGGECLYQSKILESNLGLTGLEINCKLDKETLSKSFTIGLDQSIILSSCTGSYVNFIKQDR